MGDTAFYAQDFTRGLPGGVSLPKIRSGWVYIYWIVGLVGISAISYVMYSPMNRQVAGTLFWILAAILLYFYYIKWFVMGAKKRGLGNPTKCPDYLTQYILPGSPDGTTKPRSVCLDFVGVSSNGLVKRCDKKPADCLTDPAYYFEPPTTKKMSDYRDAAANAGLIWTSVLGDV